MQEVYYIPQWDGQGDYKVSLSRRKDAKLMIGGGYRFDEYDFGEMAYPSHRRLSRWNDFVSGLVALRCVELDPWAREVCCARYLGHLARRRNQLRTASRAHA